MDSSYNPKSIEAYWSAHWEEQGYAKPSGVGEPYCIMLPPPNVTGSLHMGHGFQVSLMDSLIRYHRMSGYNTHWQVGTDHAGIATQMVVERQLSAKGQDRKQLGREAFVDEIWRWKEESGGKITQQLRRLGASVDWDRERFTMDPELAAAVQELFIRLYRDDLIYRGNRLVNWDPKLETAISDLEVINVQRQGHIWHIRYPIHGSDSHVIVATTRPETLFGDSAVAVAPNDERYADLIGKQVRLPLCDRLIPIIADDYVDPEFGSGCVKITPAHDFNDYEVGLRHNLDMPIILTTKACMNTNVPAPFAGMPREQARKAVIAALRAAELLESVQEHTHMLPIGDRSGVVIEPYLTPQWFVRSETLAKPAIDAVRDGSMRFYPRNYENTYFHWLENIQDWCISRQLWWGHRIPAWYDPSGNVYVGADAAAVRAHYQLDAELSLTQDEDVLDTWFSSALWPFSTLGWPQKTADMDTFFPNQVLVTGHDIIFYWVARMAMMSYYCTGQAPFQDIYITGIIRDENNDKMSKSKGNVIDPIDLIDGISIEDLLNKRCHGLMQPQMREQVRKRTLKAFPNGIEAHGTDALRFTFCALASTGRDVRFDPQRLLGYRNFCNKLWNAARYVLGQITTAPPALDGVTLCSADQWILRRIALASNEAKRHFAQYRFDLLSQCLYDLVWHDFCDWYIEICKPRLTQDHPEADAARATLLHALAQIIQLLHPIIPYITESIWQSLRPLLGHDKPKSILLCAYPTANAQHLAFACDPQIKWLQTIVTAVRTMRAEMHISPAKSITILLDQDCKDSPTYLEMQRGVLMSLAKTTRVDWRGSAPESLVCARQITEYGSVYIPLAGLINPKDEISRVQKQQEKITKQLLKLQKKLANPRYAEHVDPAVMAAEKNQIQEWEETIAHYHRHLKAIATLA